MNSPDVGVKVPVGNKLFAVLPGDDGPDDSACWSSYGEATEQARILTARYKRLPGAEMADAPGGTFLAENIIVHAVKLVSQETGEQVQAARTVIVTPDGKAYTTVSYWVYQSLADLFKAYGSPPWPGGKLVQVVISKSKRRGNFYVIVPYGGGNCSGVPASEVGLNVPGQEAKGPLESTSPITSQGQSEPARSRKKQSG